MGGIADTFALLLAVDLENKVLAKDLHEGVIKGHHSTGDEC